MSSQLSDIESLAIEVSNLGGIDHREENISPGITVLAGPNATNRTSFINALSTAFGVDAATLQAGRDEGYVTMDIDGAEYTHTVTRSETGTVTDGNQFTAGTRAERELAFLDESHPIRQLIRGEFSPTELRDQLMAPVDTTAIQQRISTLAQEKTELKKQLDELETLKQTRTDKQTQLERLQNELDQLESKRDEARQRVEQAEKSTEGISETITELTNEIDNKRERKADLNTVITEAEKTIEMARSDIDRLSSESPETDTADIDEAIQQLDQEKRSFKSEKDNLERQKQKIEDLLQTVKSVILDQESITEIATNYPIDATLFKGGPFESVVAQDDPLTDTLVDSESDEKTCPVCGTQVSTDQLDQVRAQFNDIVDPIESELEEVEDSISEIESDIRSLESDKKAIKDNQEDITEAEGDIRRAKDTRQGAEEELEEITTEISELEDELAEAQNEKNEEYIQAREDLTAIESNIADKQDEITAVKTEIKNADERLEEREELQEELKDKSDELTAERDKISDTESELEEKINDELETVVDLLDYDNIERVSVTARYSGPEESRDTEFGLSISRNIDGIVQSDNNLDHFSGSERAVLGLVVALAAYLVHDVEDTVPVIAIDTVEMIDSDRLNTLLQHFGSRVEYLIAALLEEDAEAVTADSTITF